MSKHEHFERNWAEHLKHNKLPNAAWVKELARMFYEFGFSKGRLTNG